MKAQGYDLRSLVIKSDLEEAIRDKYQVKYDILTSEEREFFLKYNDDSTDIFYCVRELLFNYENKEETEELFIDIERQIFKMYPEDNELRNYIFDLKNYFLSLIEQNIGSHENIFYSTTIIK